LYGIRAFRYLKPKNTKEPPSSFLLLLLRFVSVLQSPSLFLVFLHLCNHV
ncbi:unnamed protein product, partial [Arabidopsis halleri]